MPTCREADVNIKVKCFADLAERFDCDFRTASKLDLCEDATVANVIGAFGIAEDDVKIIFVNGQIARMDRSLTDGDRVTLVPSSGGM
jgi:molybdopterin converting factor small subunit